MNAHETSLTNCSLYAVIAHASFMLRWFSEMLAQKDESLTHRNRTQAIPCSLVPPFLTFLSPVPHTELLILLPRLLRVGSQARMTTPTPNLPYPVLFFL